MKLTYDLIKRAVHGDQEAIEAYLLHYDAYINFLVSYDEVGPDGRIYRHIDEDKVLAEVRAYHEARHGSERWANRAAFSEATDLFCFRAIPGVEISTSCSCSAKAAGMTLPVWRM